MAVRLAKQLVRNGTQRLCKHRASQTFKVMKIVIFAKHINLQPKLSNYAFTNYSVTDLRPQLASNYKQKLRDYLLLFQKLEMLDIGMGFDTMLAIVYNSK